MQQDTNVVYIAKLQGTAYEMGYAYGQLFGKEINDNFNNIRTYGKSKLSDFLSKLGVPSLMIDYIYGQIEPLFFYLLDLNW